MKFEINEIPSDWNFTDIRTSTFIKGRIGWHGLKASEFISDGPYLVTGTDFINGKVDWSKCYHISFQRFLEDKNIHLKENDLLITKDGSIGKTANVTNCPELATLNSGIFLLRCKDNSYYNRFLYYILNSEYFFKFLRKTAGGSTINHLYQNEFEKFVFPLPKPVEQEIILKILLSIDSVIENTESSIEKYKAIKQGMIHDLFTRGIDIKTGKLRPRYEEAPELYQPSELGFIPKEWAVKTTEELLLIKGRIGWRGLKKDEFIESGPYLITGMHFIDDKIDWANCFHISEFRYEESPEIMVQVGDVLITKDGTIGKVAYIDFLPGKASLNSHLLLLRPRNQTQLFSKYLFYELLYTRFRRYIENFKTGSTLAGLSQSAFEKYIFPLPEFEEQEIICNKLISLDKKIDSEIAYLQKLQKIKQGLMQDLLTGKKRVKAKEIN